MDRWIQIVLIITPGVWSGNWGVKFESQCALRGTSVILKCQYDYPYFQWVTSVSWSKGVYTSGSWRRISLNELPSPPHYKYIGNKWHDCSLQVNNVQSADEGRYYFSFVTSLNRWKSKGYAHLSVKELTAVVEPNAVTEGDTVRLNCESGCPEPAQIVWRRDGQRVSNSVFKARREDAGRYYCAVFGQETSRSAIVTLNVYYAPKQVTLSVSPSSNIIKGGSVTVSCSSEANPPVKPNGYSLYKDGQLMGFGQSRVISDVEPSNSGWYQCQAWNNITWRGNDHIDSPGVHLDVQYPPLNISVSVEPDYITKGSSVNLTCSGAANPAADNHTWFKWTESLGSSSLVQVGSGPVLTLPSVEETHTGLYLCYVRNRLGENNSTVMMLVQDNQQGLWRLF
ncbi:B-cell receptor CD22-like [Cololabis saira]|uniref:B-cell receptor CD22-like n=1 Tax=Cololabis saira TaxID=129043 RepID=UPI002AD51221|nr:B-cell receptor CD22-like [Cololabis saira]